MQNSGDSSTLRSNSTDTCVSESSQAYHEKDILIRVPTGYSAVTATDTNSTTSGIAGPGRIVDSLLNSAGAHLEKAMDRFAERWLHAGPNQAAHRLTSALHKAHTAHSRAKYRKPCRNEHEKDIDDIKDICQQLIWVCNGICSQCKTPYVPYILDDRMSDSIHKALIHLTEHLEYV
jgi:cation diffusion facilitator CzcD-associated flavoprotein CzcO